MRTNPNRDYYVIFTCRETMNLLNWCREHSVDVWAPTGFETKLVGTKNKRKVVQRVAQLHGYCFAPMHSWKTTMHRIPSWFMVRPMDFNRVTGQPARCTLDQLKDLQVALNGEQAAEGPEAPTPVAVGDAVEITSGPFKGMMGTVVQKRNSGSRLSVGRHFVTLPDKMLKKV